MASDINFGILLLFFMVFTVFLVQFPSNANPNNDCPKNELQISNNSILDPPGMNGKLRKQFQMENPEECSAEFTIVFPLEFDVNSNQWENGAFLEDYKNFWKFKCNGMKSTTESTTETEKSTTPILTTSAPTTVPKRKVDYIYNMVGQISPITIEFIGFSLCAPNKKGEACWLRMNMTQGKVEITSKIDGQEHAEILDVDNYVIKRNISFNLTVSVRHYFIEFQFQFQQYFIDKYYYSEFKFKHWPARWYNTIPFMGIEGLQYESAGDWKIVNFNGFEDENLPIPEEMFPVKLPFSVKFPEEITVQSAITIRGHIPKNANQFNIALLRNAPEVNEWIGDTVANLTMNIPAHTISLNSKYHANEEEIANKMVLKPEVYFEAVLVAKNMSEFEMTILSSNGKENFTFSPGLPLWSITHMNIDGDVELFDPPQIVLKEKPETDYSETLDLPLDVGDVVTITFRPTNESTESSIWLFSGAKEYNEFIGHTPLRVTFKYEPKKKTGFAYMSSTQYDNCCSLGEEVKGEESRVRQKGHAKVIITVKEEEFIINDDRNDVGTYNFAQHGYQPWSVDHIKLTGGPFYEDDEFDMPEFEITRKRMAFYLEIPYIRVLDKSLMSGDAIEIKGETKGDFKQILVHLLHGALDYHETIGLSVLQIKLYQNNMTLGAYFGKTWHGTMNKTDFSSSFSAGQSFTLYINVQPEEYKIELKHDGNTEIVHFPHQFPIWAVQYIRVEGDLKLKERPEIVKNKK